MRKRKSFCSSAASGTLHEDLRTFIVASEINFQQKHCCATVNISVWLPVTCSKTTHTHTECIIVFLSQKWLCERSTVLRYKHIVCLACKTSPTSTATKFSPVEADSLHVDRRADRHEVHSHSYHLPSKRV